MQCFAKQGAFSRSSAYPPPQFQEQHAKVRAALSRGKGQQAAQFESPPKINVSRFAMAPPAIQPWAPQIQDGDKSTSETLGDQDQSADVKKLNKTARGVSIEVDPQGAYSSPEYPDGFRWTQTIVTNTKRGGSILATPVSYVDPTPNDDSKPFYWTDAEHATHSGVFKDSPSRNPRPGGTVHWDATLSLNGVNAKDCDRFDSISYGFSVTSAGDVSKRGPSAPASIADHLSTLRSAFSDWTFN
ncbi:hypothetical protein P2G88_01010 [Aliiglaciecola sp. CAU 1673]|uniref:hypothetical protein n=1 Tax=Aliiglaciecola sp. CAU 1673 TaxID=3032595 RepID=UPI0023DC17BE|nr:hypothetical protein [Aliiglaciecola sp. CAU 1673]MDF2176829.1 hypothetical protein [Aliiglaciecola sp. CAU 1673]